MKTFDNYIVGALAGAGVFAFINDQMSNFVPFGLALVIAFAVISASRNAYLNWKGQS
jgi:hypothetical protein